MTTEQNNTINKWQNKVINSSLWAAYGDAVGFISELADVKKLEYRAGTSEIKDIITWKRKIGGQYGVNTIIPKGCYSDDTQLRLAVSRAIGHNGYFDTDSFAHIELPIWMSYQLGGGVGTILATKNLTKRGVAWSTNFYSSDNSRYVDSGGNGAAMRIQPHVWCHPSNLKSYDLIKNILLDAICTHGHPRALLGALFHGYCLYYSMIENCASSPSSWRKFIIELKEVPKIIENDSILGIVWLPEWEKNAKKSFADVWNSTIIEMLNDIDLIEPHLADKGPRAYHAIVDSMGCFLPKWRGTGSKTALLASALVLIANSDPLLCAIYSANALNSDTDTIGTMAAAIAGALSDNPPASVVLDNDYIKSESVKLTSIRYSKPCNIFIYPSISSWSAPKTNADAISHHDDIFYIAGLGVIQPLNNRPSNKNGNFLWEWFITSFGQTLFLKRREKIEIKIPSFGKYKYIDNKLNINDNIKAAKVPTRIKKIRTIQQIIDDIVKSGYSPSAIGNAILEVSKDDDGIDRGIALTALIIDKLNNGSKKFR